MSLAADTLDHAQSLAQRLDAELRHAHPKAIIAKAMVAKLCLCHPARP